MLKVGEVVGRKRLMVWVEGEVGEGGGKVVEAAKKKGKDGVFVALRGEAI